MIDLLGEGATIPPSWVFIAPFVIAFLTSLSVKDIVNTDPAALEKLKPRARKLRLGVASLLSLLVVIGQQVTGDVDATLGGLVLTGAIAFRGSGGVADILKHLGIDINKRILPDKGIDPERALIVTTAPVSLPPLEGYIPEPRPRVQREEGIFQREARSAAAAPDDDPWYDDDPTVRRHATDSKFWGEG